MKTKPDAAARLANKYCLYPELPLVERAIRSLIRREVKAERERCVAICREQFEYGMRKDIELYVGWRGAASAIQINIAKGPK